MHYVKLTLWEAEFIMEVLETGEHDSWSVIDKKEAMELLQVNIDNSVEEELPTCRKII